MATLADLAEAQFGMVTSAQAAAAGVSHLSLSRLAGDGVLHRIQHGVYRVRGGAGHRAQSLYAAWLALDPAMPAERRSAPVSGVVSHRSAARYYDLGDLQIGASEFVLPARRQSRRRDLRLHRGQLAVHEWEWVDGLPVTRPPRILADLLTDRADPSAVASIAADALRRRLASEAELSAGLASYGRRSGSTGTDLAFLHRFLDISITPTDRAHVARRSVE